MTGAGSARLRAVAAGVALALVTACTPVQPPSEFDTAAPPTSAGPTSATSASAGPSTPAGPSRATATGGASTRSAPDGLPPANRVLAISVDGLNPTALTELGPAATPSFHRLISEGASTLNARTELEETQTLPNHTGMMTGRRVDASRGGHGVSFNDDLAKTTVHRAAGEYVSSVFDVVHDRGGRTALFSAKEKFALYARTWNTAGGLDPVPPDNGRKKIDRVVLDTDNARLVNSLDTELSTQPPTFTFWHVSLPDAAGHAYGFMSPQYLDAVQQTDRLLGQVLATIDSTPGLRSGLVVVLTADHGGADARSHTDAAKLADYRIPFMAWGDRVPAGADLYALNPGFSDPGTSRPGYAGPQPIRNADVADLATGLLGLPPVPGSQLDADQTLDVRVG